MEITDCPLILIFSLVYLYKKIIAMVNLISKWLNDPNRDYETGLKIFCKFKVNNKVFTFLNVSNPDQVKINMLLGQVKKVYNKLIVNPELLKGHTTIDPVIQMVKTEKPSTGPIKIHKIEPKAATETDRIIHPDNLRSNKQYINKLLTLNWNDLSFSDKVIFNNSEKYFIGKKSLMIENSEIEKQMRSLHTKVKSIDPDDKNNENREEIMQELAELDDKKSANWEVIDTWDDSEKDKIKNTNTETAIREALKREKLIKAHKVYIYRAEKMLDKMPEKTSNQRKRKDKKIAEIERRKKELTDMGEAYKTPKNDN